MGLEADNPPIFSARSVFARRCTRYTFLRANCSARKRTLVHHRAETLRAEKICALSDPALQYVCVALTGERELPEGCSVDSLQRVVADTAAADVDVSTSMMTSQRVVAPCHVTTLMTSSRHAEKRQQSFM